VHAAAPARQDPATLKEDAVMRAVPQVLFLPVAVICVTGTPIRAASYRLSDVTVVAPADGTAMTSIAADEIRGYVYRLTRVYPTAAMAPAAGKPSIILRTGPGDRLPEGGADASQNFALYGEGANQVVHGASGCATLWAAYHLIESWGVGFYLGGDSLPKPDAKMRAAIVEAQCRPALAIRGNLPWFNFLNSPTTWNPQDYKTFFAQMAKQKANFIGFHAYDHEPFGAYDITNGGAKMGGPLMTTISPHRWWSPPAIATSDFLFGTDQFFNRGEWGCEVGIDDAWAYAPGRATRLQQQMMAEALAYAKRLGIRTCLGWEVTGNPADPATREAFKRRLRHTLATYPLDYFWIWQSEGRGTAGHAGNWVAGAPNDASIVPDAKIREAFAYLGPNHDLREAKRIAEYILLADAAIKELAPQVRLIVSGWGGDAHMKFSTLYIGLDRVVPKDVIFASLDNIDPRSQDHVSEAYGKVSPDRERWPIPWFESDGGHARCDQTGPQTNVTAFEPLLKDIVKKGCQGALGIHWRTRNVEDVAGYLYRFGWDPQLTAAEFFKQYARDKYGPEDAERMAKVRLRLEEFGPQYVGAVGCVECSTPFTWFVRTDTAERGHEPNLAGHLPIVERFPELEALWKDLILQGVKAGQEGRADAAIAYTDLGGTIRWLVTRAKVGLAIWDPSSPLEKRLRQAERLLAQGKTSDARKAALSVLRDLDACDFRLAFQSLAMTCRTRGELGMLATANARYGRFYAAFVQRIAYILGEPLPQCRGPETWRGPETFTVFPVPSQIAANETVAFDAVLLPRKPDIEFRIDLTCLSDPHAQMLWLKLCRLGGAYHGAVFFPPSEGTWAWKLTPCVDAERITREHLLPSGVITVGPAAGPVQPAYRPTQQTAKAQADPVLKVDFERPAREVGEVVGKARQCEGVRGSALDLREGGFVRITEGAAPAAFSGPFSIAFFAKPELWDAAKDMPVLMCKGTWDGDGWLVQLFQGQVRVCLGHQRCLDAGTLKPGEWMHVAITYDGLVLRLYLDGREAGSAEMEAPPAASPLPLRLGTYQEEAEPSAYAYHGCLDELAFYNRPLGEREIAALAKR
jgi:hypothetical protein